MTSSTHPALALGQRGAPSAKRAKLSTEDGSAAPRHPDSAHPQDITSEFPLRSLEDFYKDCPTYRLPVEIGSFSLDNKGKQVLDRSQLKYFSPPPPPPISSRQNLNFDLRVGYDKYVPSPRSVPADKLNPILRWVAMNGDCFRPKPFSPKSPNKGDGEVGGNLVDETGSRRLSVGETYGSQLPVPKERYVMGAQLMLL